MRDRDLLFGGPRGAARSRAGQGGFTLLETAIVAGFIAIVAAVALPNLRPANDQKLDLAAHRVAGALRFARSEAIRTGVAQGVQIFANTEQVVVSRADLSQSTPYAPNTPADPAWVLFDPLTKQPANFDLMQDSATAGVDVLTDPFRYVGAGAKRSFVIFDAQGMPFSKRSGGFSQLEDGAVVVELNGRQRTVRLAPVTGKVTVE